MRRFGIAKPPRVTTTMTMTTLCFTRRRRKNIHIHIYPRVTSPYRFDQVKVGKSIMSTYLSIPCVRACVRDGEISNDFDLGIIFHFENDIRTLICR
ncbi:hypothetical protein BofuT4_uP133140.1 [Botrytis cinerea T4]|uniref:Uncharacterized protein n=1 Tax=Botryotinia fuckeliana (strain T4) TaxID=999810 RepID=G2YQ62_BOTF4|nr:hypothetical protein BofuT4_uP133140.1 [Botrytis cinerea T4]